MGALKHPSKDPRAPKHFFTARLTCGHMEVFFRRPPIGEVAMCKKCDGLFPVEVSNGERKVLEHDDWRLRW